MAKGRADLSVTKAPNWHKKGSEAFDKTHPHGKSVTNLPKEQIKRFFLPVKSHADPGKQDSGAPNLQMCIPAKEPWGLRLAGCHGVPAAFLS